MRSILGNCIALEAPLRGLVFRGGVSVIPNCGMALPLKGSLLALFLNSFIKFDLHVNAANAFNI